MRDYLQSKNFTVKPDGSTLFKGDLTGASGTFSGTVQVGGTTLTTGNTLNSNTTSGDVGLENVQNLDAQNQVTDRINKKVLQLLVVV